MGFLVAIVWYKFQHEKLWVLKTCNAVVMILIGWVLLWQRNIHIPSIYLIAVSTFKEKIKCFVRPPTFPPFVFLKFYGPLLWTAVVARLKTTEFVSWWKCRFRTRIIVKVPYGMATFPENCLKVGWTWKNSGQIQFCKNQSVQWRVEKPALFEYVLSVSE